LPAVQNSTKTVYLKTFSKCLSSSFTQAQPFDKALCCLVDGVLWQIDCTLIDFSARRQYSAWVEISHSV